MNDEFSQLEPGEKSSQETYKSQLEEPKEEGVEVDYQMLQPETLAKLIQEFVMREGTDYGAVEATLEKKTEDIRRQLQRKDLKIVFDLTSETCSIVSK